MRIDLIEIKIVSLDNPIEVCAALSITGTKELTMFYTLDKQY